MVKIAVAPLTGAWIEIVAVSGKQPPMRVAPLTGAWIEIGASGKVDESVVRRSPHGSVD